MQKVQVARIIDELIAEKGIDLFKLSHDLNIPYSTLHGWKVKGRIGDFEKALLVSEYFGVTIRYLVFGLQPKKISQEVQGQEPQILSGKAIKFSDDNVGWTLEVTVKKLSVEDE